MYCKKCGNQLNDNATFCPKCGQRVESDQQAQNTQAPPVHAQNMGVSVQSGGVNIGTGGNMTSGSASKKGHTARTVVVSVAATIIALFGLIMWIGSSSSDETRTAASTSDAQREQAVAETSVPLEDVEPVGESSPEAVAELLGYVDQAEELVAKAYDDLGNVEDSTEGFVQRADIMEKLHTDLSELQGRANAISGMDTNLATAGTEYFNMLCDSQKAYFEVNRFFADFLTFDKEVLGYSPQFTGYENYATVTDYYNEIETWYQIAKERYLAMDTCPVCMESEWKKYGEILDLSQTIADKLKTAVQCNDFLRMYSALNLSDRYNIVEELQYDAFINCEKGQVVHSQRQRNVSSKLAEEIHAYAQMGTEERNAYEFEYVHTNKIFVDYEAIDTIYPSLYNTYDAFVIVKAGCVSGTRKIVVEAEIPGLTQAYKESFMLDSGYRTIYIKPPALTGDLGLTSAKDAQLKVTISEQDGTLIEAKTFAVTIKSKYDKILYTDEYGIATNDNALCWLTPESQAISELKRVAIDELSKATNGTYEQFIGYQGNVGDTYLQTAGIMRAMYEMGVRYNMDPFSYDEVSQHVLFPEDVLSQKSGLCIETALVVASALQSANMHAFLVLPPGHAMVAVETGNGTGEYFLIETTCLDAGTNNWQILGDGYNRLMNGQPLPTVGYNEERDRYSATAPIMYLTAGQWDAYISHEYKDGRYTYLIDCDDAVVLGLTPFVN